MYVCMYVYDYKLDVVTTVRRHHLGFYHNSMLLWIKVYMYIMYVCMYVCNTFPMAAAIPLKGDRTFFSKSAEGRQKVVTPKSYATIHTYIWSIWKPWLRSRWPSPRIEPLAASSDPGTVALLYTNVCMYVCINISMCVRVYVSITMYS